MGWWTLRRLAELVVRIRRLCAAHRQLASSTLDSGTSSVSKAQSSRHKPERLTQLTQPESWHHLMHTDTQQRLCGRNSSHTQHSSPPGETGTIAREGGEGKSCASLLSEPVKDTLSNSPWTRTHKQVDEAVKELKVCNDFCDYPAPVQHSLCKVGWYQSLEKGRVIFREHTPAYCYYFVISGNVLVTSEQEPAHTLTTGSSFGDESIVDKCARNMTCSALTHVELLVISKSDFLDLCLRQSRISYQSSKHLTFCKTVSVLSHWPLHLLETHSDHCKVAHFKANGVVVKDSTKNPWVYIIMSGSCRVVKRFIYGSEEHTEKTQKRKSYSNPAEISKLALGSTSRQSSTTNTLRKNNSPTIAQGADQARRSHRLPHTVSTPQMSVRQHLPKRQFLLQLQVLKPKDTFGLSSFLYKDEPSVTLVSNGAEVVMLSKYFLHQHFKEATRDRLKRQITQFPSQEMMLKRIREHYS